MALARESARGNRGLVSGTGIRLGARLDDLPYDDVCILLLPSLACAGSAVSSMGCRDATNLLGVAIKLLRLGPKCVAHEDVLDLGLSNRGEPLVLHLLVREHAHWVEVLGDPSCLLLVHTEALVCQEHLRLVHQAQRLLLRRHARLRKLTLHFLVAHIDSEGQGDAVAAIHLSIKTVECLDIAIGCIEKPDDFLVAPREDLERQKGLLAVLLCLVLDARDAVDVVSVNLRSGDLEVGSLALCV